MHPIVPYALLVVVLYLITDHKRVHKTLDEGPVVFKSDVARGILLSVPIITAIVLDVKYGAFSLKRLGVPVAWNKTINRLLQTMGAYGMVQILAQDSGLKTGIQQRDSLQASLYFVPVAVGMAFSICDNRSQAILSVLLYYHLKYAVSNNITSSVCFEDV